MLERAQFGLRHQILQWKIKVKARRNKLPLCSCSSRPQEFNRPTTFEPQICYQHLRDVIFEHGLADLVGRGFSISVSEYPDENYT